MRFPLSIATFIALLVGLAAGAAIHRTTSSTRSPELSISGSNLDRASTSQLGELLMARVGRRFVADKRNQQREYAIWFYDTPKPFSSWLCRVNQIQIPAKIYTGRIDRPQDFWEDDIKVETFYGLWTSPAHPAPVDRRDKACAAYRDFDHLIAEEGLLSVGRGAYLLDQIIAQSKAGRLRFPVRCREYPADLHSAGSQAELSRLLQGTKCDGAAALRRLTLRGLGRVKALSEREIEGGAIHTDELSVSLGKNEYAVLVVTGRRRVGRHSIEEADVEAVEVNLTRTH